MKTEMEITF